MGTRVKIDIAFLKYAIYGDISVRKQSAVDDPKSRGTQCPTVYRKDDPAARLLSQP